MGERRFSVEQFEASRGVLPIRIRGDLVIRVFGIPHDLTQDEAAKICRVVQALSQAPR